MRGRGLGLIAALFVPALVACGSGSETPGKSSSSSSGASSTSGSGSTGSGGGAPSHCGWSGIALGAEAIPGTTVTLTSGAGDGYEVTWTVSVGSLSSPTGASVEWTIPDDIAVHVGVPATITATASGSDCDAQSDAHDVVVDWPDAYRTIILQNPSIAGSDEVAAYYAAFRGVPTDHICAVDAPDIDLLPFEDAAAFVQAVDDCAAAIGKHIHYIVPVWGVPYTVKDVRLDWNQNIKVKSSLDALLVYGPDVFGMEDDLLSDYWRHGNSMTGSYKPFIPIGEYRESIAPDEYFLVARIDGKDKAAALALVDRAKAADDLAKAGGLAGTVYVDGRLGLPHPDTDEIGSYENGEWNMIGTENIFTELGTYPVVADYDDEQFGHDPAPLEAPDALYYAGWYGHGVYDDVFEWQPGAIGGHLDSCSACDIRGEKDWVGGALASGITATFGAVNEPFTRGLPAYDQVFRYLLDGANFAEAGYSATMIGAWQIVFVGDPLYRPYPAAR